MRTTILGGVLFLAPFALFVILLSKVFEISLKVVAPIDKLMPVETLLGVATLNILAIVLILLVCYIAGLLGKRAFFGQRMQKFDGFLVDMIPGYAVFKTMVGSASSEEGLDSILKPVLVRFDDYEQIAFLTEKGERESTLFLPGSPSAWSGSTVIATNERITPLDLPAYQTTRLLRTFGRGSLTVRARALGADDVPESNG